MDPWPRLSVLLPVVMVLGPVGAVGPLNGSATEKPASKHQNEKLVPTSHRNVLRGLSSIIDSRFLRLDDGLIGIGLSLKILVP